MWRGQQLVDTFGLQKPEVVQSVSGHSGRLSSSISLKIFLYEYQNPTDQVQSRIAKRCCSNSSNIPPFELAFHGDLQLRSANSIDFITHPSSLPPQPALSLYESLRRGRLLSVKVRATTWKWERGKNRDGLNCKYILWETMMLAQGLRAVAIWKSQ